MRRVPQVLLVVVVLVMTLQAEVMPILLGCRTHVYHNCPVPVHENDSSRRIRSRERRTISTLEWTSILAAPLPCKRWQERTPGKPPGLCTNMRRLVFSTARPRRTAMLMLLSNELDTGQSGPLSWRRAGVLPNRHLEQSISPNRTA